MKTKDEFKRIAKRVLGRRKGLMKRLAKAERAQMLRQRTDLLRRIEALEVEVEALKMRAMCPSYVPYAPPYNPGRLIAVIN